MTFNKRKISIFGHIILFINWFLTFGLNSHLYDNSIKINNYIPIIIELLFVVLGNTMLAVYSHWVIKEDNNETAWSIQLLVLFLMLSIVSIVLVNNNAISFLADTILVDKNVDYAIFYAASFLFMFSGIIGIDCRRSYINVKSLLAICIAVLGVCVIIKNL